MKTLRSFASGLVALVIFALSPVSAPSQLGPAPQIATNSPGSTPQIAGRVVRSDTGAPIQGAKVDINSGQPNRACCHHAITDSNGEYSFEYLADGTYIASAFAEGFVTGDYHCSPGPASVCKDREQHVTASSHLRMDFKLLPEAVIRGVVVTPNGQPVGRGLNVTAVPTILLRESSSGVVYSTWSQATTDDAGGFTLKTLPPGNYLIRVNQTMGGRTAPTAADHWYHEAWYGDTPTPQGALPIEIKEAEHRDGIRVTVQPEERYAVTLWMSGPNGRPPPREYIIIIPDSNTTALKQPDGSYLIRNVSPGHYRLGVFAAGLPLNLASPHNIEIDVAKEDLSLKVNITGK